VPELLVFEDGEKQADLSEVEADSHLADADSDISHSSIAEGLVCNDSWTVFLGYFIS
jgi:hypothetical protein